MFEKLVTTQNALQHAVTEYVNTCVALLQSHNAAANRARPWAHCGINLAGDDNQRFIDWVNSQMLHVCVTFNNARNQCAPVNCMHSELLIEIFRLGINDPDTSVQDAIQSAVSLSGVCSYWRRLITQTSSFWSLIPLGHTIGSEQITALCLKRAGNRPLDVHAYASQLSPWRIESALAHHVHKIRSLSLMSELLSHIHSVMKLMLNLESPSTLKELLIEYDDDLPANIFPGTSTLALQRSFNILTNGLQVLDLFGANLDWCQFTFNELQVLRLRHSVLGAGVISWFDQLAHIIATSPNLRVLKLANITLKGARKNAIPMSMQSLETLSLSNLGVDVLRTILESISPGAYDIEVVIADSNFMTRSSLIDSINEGITQLTPVFQKFYNITTLGLIAPGDGVTGMFTPSQLRSILGMLPSLNTLWFHGPVMTSELLSAVTRLQSTESAGTLPPPFPQLRTIRMKFATLMDSEAFKVMITSHPIEHVDIMGCRIPQDNTPHNTVPLDRTSPLLQWLSLVVPKLSLVSYN